MPAFFPVKYCTVKIKHKPICFITIYALGEQKNIKIILPTYSL